MSAVSVFQGGLFHEVPPAPPAVQSGALPPVPLPEARSLPGAEAALREAEAWVLCKPGDSVTTRLYRLSRELRAIIAVLQAGQQPAGQAAAVSRSRR